ncbi:MAG: hypothetical protein HC935_02570 [Pseudanabaena sp. SU_2_4]|nr:hypothetical protein [Pseudanabaena sp. SU_2_4]
MSQEKMSDTNHQLETDTRSWNGASKLRPQTPKAAQTNPSTTPNASNPSTTSGGNESSNKGE